MGNGSTNPDESENGIRGSENPLCGGGFCCIYIQEVDSVVEKLAWMCFHYQQGGMRGVDKAIGTGVGRMLRETCTKFIQNGGNARTKTSQPCDQTSLS